MSDSQRICDYSNKNEEEEAFSVRSLSEECKDIDKTLKNSNREVDHRQQQCSQATDSHSQTPWNIIIVNQIPKEVDRVELILIFTKYGRIVDYCHSGEFARITFATEEEARKVWEASQESPIRYGNDVLVITLFSDDYCPIESLPANCLIQIFLRVEKANDKLTLESVSTRWQDLSKKSWTTVTELISQDGLINFQIIAHAKKYLRELVLCITDNIEELLRSLVTHCTQFEEMNLCFCTGVYKLKLYGPCPIGDIATMEFKKNLELLYILFSQNQKLRQINLDFDSPWRHGPIDLSNISSNLQFLECMGGGVRSPIRLTNDYSKFCNLQVLSLQSVQVVGLDKESFANMINLKGLKMFNCIGHVDHIAGIADLKNLEHLCLEKADLTDDILEKVLKNNKNLNYLNITDNHRITDASFKYVRQLPTLTVVIAEGTRITDRYFAYMPRLRCVSVNKCSISDEGVKRFLETTDNIERLEMWDTSVTIQSVMAALQWTKRTGKLLHIFVNDEIRKQFKKLKIEKTDKLIVKTDMIYWLAEYEEYYEHTLNIHNL